MNAIGIDLGGTNIKAVLINGQGEILAQETKQGGTSHGTAWKETVKAAFDQIRKISDQPFVAGLAAPGLPDENNRMIIYMPVRLEGLVNFDWSGFFGVDVVVVNDAHAAMMAEAKLGVATKFRNALMLTLGTGIGGGILIDGKLYQGMHQRAGSIGDITVNAESKEIGITGMPGSIEDAFGNETVGKRSGGKFSSTLALVEAHKAGDSFATDVWLTSVNKLAVAICSLINTLSPEVVILGGGISHAGDALFHPLETYIAKYEMRPQGKATPIIKAQFTEFSGAIGAACFAMERGSHKK